ncbi:MAG: RdgB/HAM1 family non-canonical purine NTP pyrophosphatase [Amylibacter sp.]|nr:RdgB/HAM1 family non-canonical purine NTP pyrophosphatase [Amylibacter sp.]
MRKFVENKLVLASHNKGKLLEITKLFKPFGKSVISAGELGFAEPAETEDTFEGNARIKAHFAAKSSGLPALSDDSGLQVLALDNAPGVYSADWAETPNGRDFEMAMGKVWDELQKTNKPAPHKARFICVLCVAWPDGHDEIFRGTVDGTIVWPMRGSHGFGYDPIFQPSGYTQTFGEIDPAEKHAISHRADAFAKLTSECLHD